MNNKELRHKMIRHGEILLIPIDDLPKEVEEIYSGNEFIVAKSESHHHHVAVGDITVFRPLGADSSDIYLRANKTSVIEHHKTFDKHETKTLQEGLYLCRPKVEFDPFEKLMRQVQD